MASSKTSGIEIAIADPSHVDSGIRTGRKPRRFYVGIAVLMTGIVLTGFWPSYFGPLLRGAATRPWVIHLHGIVFIGWMGLLLTQVTLVSLGQTAAHRKIGTVGIAYGCLVLIMGLVVGFAAPLLHLAAGEWDRNQAAGFLLIILGDMTLFGGFFIPAMIFRRQPEIHKRLILLSTVALLFAAVGRMKLEQRPLIFLTVWLAPVLLGMGYDVLTRRRVHATYIIGLGVLLLGFSRVLFLQSEAWLRIGRALIGMFA